MNRRNAIKAAAIAGLMPAGAIGRSMDDKQRAALEQLLQLPDEQAFRVYLASMGMRPGHKYRDQLKPLLDAGVPVDEAYHRVTNR